MTEAPTTCPRCGAAFHCGVADAQPCACSTLRLDAATLAALRERYRGCLCLSCLVALQAEAEAVDSQPGVLNASRSRR